MRKVPARFFLMGHRIDVEIVDDLIDEYDTYGRWLHDRQLIQIQSAEDGRITKSLQLQTFWHEAMHALLDVLSEDELSENEKLVDQLGQGIHQILTTKKGGI